MPAKKKDLKLLFVKPCLRPGGFTKLLPVGLASVMTYFESKGYDFTLLDIDIDEFSDEYVVGNWADENKSIFQVMKLEKIGLFLILTLIIVVAAFNIVSSLIMLVLEKSREIAILKALGANDSGIRKIFFFQGLVIGSLGTIGGVLLGLAICWVLMNFEIIDIPPGVYPGGNRIPVLIDWFDVALTTLASFVICLLVTLYPSTKASRLNPVDPLRYE